MHSYQIKEDAISKFIRRDDGACIPLTMDNRDCAQFVQDWHDGATVLDNGGAGLSYSEAAVTALGLTPPA